MDEKGEPLYECRIEEITFLANVVLDSFMRDKSDFIQLSPDYDDPFTTDYLAQIKVVEDLITPAKLTGELKKLTDNLGNDYNKVRNIINRLERYVSKAFESGLTLTMAPGDFGFKPVRDEVRLKNDEGIISKLNVVKSNLLANKAVLEPKGFSAAVQAEFKTLISVLTNDSLAQTRKKKEREALVTANVDQLNKLWYLITDVFRTGKAIYRETDKNKIKDYTYEHVIKDIRLKRKAAETEAAKD